MGIPQGSPISSLPYLIYTTPLIQSVNRSCNVKAVGFMDDWTLYQKGNQFEKNTREIEKAYNHLITEGDKLHFIYFTNKRIQEQLSRFNQYHQSENSVKLGVWLDQRLNFKIHIGKKLEASRRLQYVLSELIYQNRLQSKSSMAQKLVKLKGMQMN
ncbi:unnamed protein product [Ambrosiozyma monospora]|uniref:Unnamed protein product n=1 Tax=Ambrosiozyma monospora TaxID=43982 RepID=A0A9W6YY23_AMBMO|nr:unnamed protein product [Ambrosiozyma monospora]